MLVEGISILSMQRATRRWRCSSPTFTIISPLAGRGDFTGPLSQFVNRKRAAIGPCPSEFENEVFESPVPMFEKPSVIASEDTLRSQIGSSMAGGFQDQWNRWLAASIRLTNCRGYSGKSLEFIHQPTPLVDILEYNR